uniref:Uncharacterized protein n=1 Tax=Anguilla anguilla TaxID=7936 RepID=A0A0E9Q0X9_ANGAN
MNILKSIYLSKQRPSQRKKEALNEPIHPCVSLQTKGIFFSHSLTSVSTAFIE